MIIKEDIEVEEKLRPRIHIKERMLNNKRGESQIIRKVIPISILRVESIPLLRAKVSNE